MVILFTQYFKGDGYFSKDGRNECDVNKVNMQKKLI
jgi:hypothetical protein